ncbi:nucleoside-triphosphatase, cancer-related [Rhinolophus ferrumequinum]|uniref:Nucleoside-triphosphatase, cancer-related n=1 Tax=Rhinolophus ferrumequinum TaxID=59479 RepID=A0A7J7REZ1_RHIFE|nr:nucleoside-triphosphatase, cancer-related [Rhinolophus ferrumequinum]
MARHVFLTGSPGVGKTTLIQKASEVLKSSGMPVDGFYTEEVRQGGRRIGFDVVTLSGLRGPLSRVGQVPAVAQARECVSSMRLGKWSFSASLSSRPLVTHCPPQGSWSSAPSPSPKGNRWPLWKRYGTGPTSWCSVSPRRTETTF